MDLMQIVIISILGLALSFWGVLVVRHYTLRRSKLDIPNGRSSHIVPTPRGGGLAIVSVTTILLLFTILSKSDMSLTRILVFIIASIGIASIGLADDWWRILSAKTRLGIQFVIVLVFVLSSGVVTELYLPIIHDLYIGTILGGLITFFWIIGLINVYNFMDGSDGLAGTQAVLAGSTWAIIFFVEDQETLGLLSIILAVSSLGFLALNAPPAKIFMGDVGSTFLGFVFSAVPVLAFAEMKNPRLMITGGLIVGIFVFDSTFTICRRIRNGENLLEAHCSHLYQRLIRLGYSHRMVAVRYASLMILSSLGGLLYYFSENKTVLFGVLAGTIVLYLMLANRVSWLEANYMADPKSSGTLIPTRSLGIDKPKQF